MLEWLHSLGGDLRSLFVAIFGSIAGAIVGGVIKWLFDRAMIKELKQQREDARQDRQAAILGRENALKEREKALVDLAMREAENQERQRKLDELRRELARPSQRACLSRALFRQRIAGNQSLHEAASAG